MLRESLLELDRTSGLITASDYCLTMKSFKALAKKYKGEDLLKRLAFVYFMEDPRSSYAGFTEEVKWEEVCLSQFNKKDWKEDALTKACREEYSSLDSSAVILLKSARASISKMKEWLDNIDIMAVDDNGRPLYDPSKHSNLLEKMGKTMAGLKALEEEVKKESEQLDTRGGVTINRYNE
jgi:hypothetical protein